MSMTHLCLIDGSNMMHRAFSVARSVLRASDGMELGGAVLFSQMLGKLMERMQEGRLPPSHAAIFFDPSRENTWRRKVSADYKAHRPEMEEELRAQVPFIHEACREMGIGCAVAPEHEADDLIGAYAEDAVRAGARVSIVSSDKDLMQLVRPGVLQLNPVSQVWFNETRVEEKLGVRPDQVRDYLAMAGDKGDGVPGARGIGPKAAQSLLATFGSLDEILAHRDEVEKPSWRRILEGQEAEIRVSRTLVSLDSDGAPRPIGEEDMRICETEPRAAMTRWRSRLLAA